MNAPDPQLTDQIWNSLKIAIIVIAALAPVIIIYLAIRFKRAKKRLTEQHQVNQRMLEKRMEVYERIGPKLNDILCYYTYTGNWKDFTPADILKLKKELDKEMKIHTPLYSDDLIKKYDSFMLVCFVSHTGWEYEEKIKSLYNLREEHIGNWNDDWIPFFDTNNVVEGPRVKALYDDLMSCFKKELEVQ